VSLEAATEEPAAAAEVAVEPAAEVTAGLEPLEAPLDMEAVLVEATTAAVVVAAAELPELALEDTHAQTAEADIGTTAAVTPQALTTQSCPAELMAAFWLEEHWQARSAEAQPTPDAALAMQDCCEV